jgi:chromosome segregation ATPase
MESAQTSPVRGGDRKDKSSRTVKFAATEADQALLQAVEQTLEAKSLSFSDLCKQSLQHWLNPAGQQSDVPLQQQILDLQMQVARLEGKEEARQRYALRRLEQQMRELSDRLESLERKEFLEQQVRQLTDRLARLEIPGGAIALPNPPLPEPLPLEPSHPQEVDPLLNRLGPLLEDF